MFTFYANGVIFILTILIFTIISKKTLGIAWGLTLFWKQGQVLNKSFIAKLGPDEFTNL